jgi:hypothetical protein
VENYDGVVKILRYDQTKNGKNKDFGPVTVLEWIRRRFFHGQSRSDQWSLLVGFFSLHHVNSYRLGRDSPKPGGIPLSGQYRLAIILIVILRAWAGKTEASFDL